MGYTVYNPPKSAGFLGHEGTPQMILNERILAVEPIVLGMLHFQNPEMINQDIK